MPVAPLTMPAKNRPRIAKTIRFSFMNSVAVRLRSRQGWMPDDGGGVRKRAAGTFRQKLSGETLLAGCEEEKPQKTPRTSGLHHHLSGGLSPRPRKKEYSRDSGQPPAAAWTKCGAAFQPIVKHGLPCLNRSGTAKLLQLKVV